MVSNCTLFRNQEILQATKSGKKYNSQYVLSAVKGSTKVIDLFCGRHYFYTTKSDKNNMR